MSSKAQRRKGYPLPENVEPEGTLSFCVTIPNDPAFYNAMYYQLHSLGKWWFWKRDETRPTDASASAMTWRDVFSISENCGEEFNMTPAELTQAICDGLVCAAPRIGLMLAAGKSAGAEFDENGNIIPPTDATQEEPEPITDDPETVIDETLASRAGGVINTRLWIQRILNDMAAWHFAAVPIIAVPNRLATLYGFDPTTIDEWVDYYWNVDATPDTVITLLTSLDSEFFCRGLSSETFANYALNKHVITTDRETLFQLAPHLSQELLNKWFETGTDTMSTDYLAYSCVKIPSYEFTLQIGVALNDPVVLKANHRYEIIASGHMLDSSDGSIQDAWFYKTTAAQPVFSNSDFNIQIGGAVKIDPTTFEVTYDAVNHRYIHTVDMGAISAGAQWTWNRNSGMAAGTTTSPSGGLLVKVRDLGEIGI